MITIPLIAGESFTRGTYADLVNEHSVLMDYGCTRDDLGESSYPEFHIFGYSLGDPKNPTIVIQAGIHGGETGSHHWPAQFMKFLANPPDGVWKNAVYRLRRRFHFYLIGCLNPYGYENNYQGNANDVDLNRNYDYNWEESNTPYSYLTKGTAPFSEPETQISRDICDLYRPVMWVDCHSSGESHPRVWMVLGNPERPMYRQMYNDFRNTFDNSMLAAGLPEMRVTTGGSSSNTRGYMGTRFSKYGTPIMSCLLEGTSLDDPELHATKAINALLMLVLYAENWMYNHRLTLTKIPF